MSTKVEGISQLLYLHIQVENVNSTSPLLTSRGGCILNPGRAGLLGARETLSGLLSDS